MAFIESPRFPDDVALDGMEGGPRYRTEIVVVAGGAEQRNIAWALDLGSWNLATGIKTPSNFEAVRDLFHMARGRAHGFRLRDWSDYGCSYSRGIIVMLSTTVGQLHKRRGFGVFEDRIITKPVAGTVTVRRTRAGVPSDISVTLDATTGGVTIAGHQAGDTYAWAGEFDRPVRFDTDELMVTQTGPARYEDGRPLLSCDSLPLVEIRVPGAVA